MGLRIPSIAKLRATVITVQHISVLALEVEEVVIQVTQVTVVVVAGEVVAAATECTKAI